VRALIVVVLSVTAISCRAAQSNAPESATPSAQNLVIITIDTLRADRVGAYGYQPARTPTLDALAGEGAIFSHAYATAPITLTSHASLLTSRYPAGHGARHNGMRIDPQTPTLAGKLADAGFATGAFIAAFPLDRRFGLIKGFQTYGDRMPPSRSGRAVNERPGREVVDEALAWLASHRDRRFFLWVHLFEPHAPYGDPSDPRHLPAQARYDEEVAEADRQAGRLVAALQPIRSSTLIVAAADHGEAFGEHGEIGHSIFVYDTTLRVPLILTGPGVPSARTIDDRVALIDVAPTVMHLLGVVPYDADGIDMGPALTGTRLPERVLYAESFAPLLDFGWSALRTIRSSQWKYIEAPRPELYNITDDPNEDHDVTGKEKIVAAQLGDRLSRQATPLQTNARIEPEARARLQALGYANGSGAPTMNSHVDPKDRKEEAARLARVTAGELSGPELERALRSILASDPENPQANLRLGYVLLDSNRCQDAARHFQSAIASHLPSADAHLGLAACELSERRFDAAAATLRQAERIEPGNPVVTANLGIVLSDGGNPGDALEPLQRALTIDPDLNQARFSLAIAFARLGRRTEAATTAEELLRRLPPDAPQRREVERLIRATKSD
jgi:choline-sulfatase